ncbi:MAG: hypothetical protein DWH82_03700 [Planctomycetota bacterium]|nr:MAG: hypothetical protein DWH82_03700 [Planctomycetota bacterium]
MRRVSCIRNSPGQMAGPTSPRGFPCPVPHLDNPESSNSLSTTFFRPDRPHLDRNHAKSTSSACCIPPDPAFNYGQEKAQAMRKPDFKREKIRFFSSAPIIPPFRRMLLLVGGFFGVKLWPCS